ARIARMPSVRESSRIDTAMAENESSAPVIHSTTGTSWAGVTESLERRACSPDGAERHPGPAAANAIAKAADGGHPHYSLLAIRYSRVSRISSLNAGYKDYSLSGWLSGLALSKAGSFRQAASAATILGNLSSGTLKRRALATCGTRQTSASVTLSPNE